MINAIAMAAPVAITDHAPDFDVFVPGRPRPQGSKTRNANGSMRESSKYVKGWREEIEAMARLVWRERPENPPGGVAIGAPLAPLNGPLMLGVEFLFERPQSHYHWTQSHGVRIRQALRADAPTYMTGVPDMDKCKRAVGDALKTARVVKDDSLFVLDHPSGCKRYANHGEQPGVRIRIWRIT